MYGKDHAEEKKENKFDIKGMIMHHISDMHSFPLFSFEKEGKDVHIDLPLPIILISNGQFFFFLSSEFHHGESIVTKGTNSFVLHHEKIYETDINGTLELDEKGHPHNKRPIDLSITRNVFSLWLSAILLLVIFFNVAKKYNNPLKKPSGIQSLLEPIILFVRDDIAIQQIGKHKADKYIPFLLTLFFFIWINNLLGIIPFFPGGSNLTGNISVTFVLAIITFIITNFSGNRSYWRHILAPPGIPVFVYIILVPIEIIGLFTKPFALMVRLFANITAGHIIMLSMASLIFIFSSLAVSLPVSFLLQFIMSILELLVGFLQAFIFTLLSALFIGMAVHEETH
ncbi:MAG: F0F1 ATP synthase subunit A [Marinilabiliaceae bacterium]|nr:F0F1 ATP synthase subunit A [Marinilabiliaceae bacterium]